MARTEAIGSARRIHTFCHAGDIGDVIYSLPTIRAMGGGSLILHSADGTRQRMTASTVELLRPLLEAQSYIDSVRFSQTPEGYPLDSWRKRMFPVGCNLADRTLDMLGLPHIEREYPWIKVEARFAARVIIHCSPRYRNPKFPWSLISGKYGDDLAFVGLPEEFRDFKSRFGAIRYFRPKNFLEMARIIAGAELYIGNQSAPLAIAFAMRKKILVEQSPEPNEWNCHFARPNVTYVLNGTEKLPELKPRYFAQHQQDKWLEENWGSLGLPRVGFFVEVGAGDGITNSMSKWLEESMQWRGILIEPDPRNLKNIKNRRAEIWPCAIGKAKHFLYMAPDARKSHLVDQCGEGTIEISTIGLDDIVAGRRVDLVSIDTNGDELSAWQTMTSSRPTVVMVTSLKSEDASAIAAIQTWANNRGYSLRTRLGPTSIFVRKPSEQDCTH
jgi:FkbM family methyltransferase